MVDQVHVENADRAKRLYLETLDAQGSADDWHQALRVARRVVADALRASSYLKDVPGALITNGGHMLAFRHLMAPPKSQDQFKLCCPPWSKGTEKDNRPVKPKVAHAVADVFEEWLDPAIGRWLVEERKPTQAELRTLLLRVSALIAQKQVDTAKRNRLANAQEAAVVQLLLEKGWQKMPSSTIERRAALPPKHFMHKTRFATATQTPQEVDIACGLSGSYVAAMECKVTNDATNSVKRINDVLKKATAWKAHWGSFVKTAALLQGVIKAEDVQRLSDEGVVVFWSHALDEFGAWLDTRI